MAKEYKLSDKTEIMSNNMMLAGIVILLLAQNILVGAFGIIIIFSGMYALWRGD